MKPIFTQHFQGTYKRPKSITDLQWCVQARNESSREFVSRWSEVKNACEGVSETQVMHAFKQSLRKGMQFRFMVFSDQSTTLGGLLACANRYAIADDDNRDDGESRRREAGRKKVDDQADPPQEVAVTFGKGSQSSGKWQGKKPANDRPSRPPKVTYETSRINLLYITSRPTARSLT